MPTVPKYNTPQVRNVPAPTVYQSDRGAQTLAAQAGTGLEAFGKGLQNLGDAGIKIATLEQLEDDKRHGKESESELNRRMNLTLYGDDKTVGYFGTYGAAAVDNSEKIKEELNKARDEIRANVKNERVGRLFDKAAQAKLDTAFNQIGAHVTKERTVANLSASQARQQGAIDNAVLAPNDTNIVNQSLAIINNEVMEQARISGHPPAVIKENLEKARTLMYFKMIDGALKRQKVEEAVALFKKYGSQMDPTVAANTEHLLEKPKLIRSAQIEVDKYLALSNTNNRNEIMARVKKDLADKPELRDEVGDRLTKEFTRQDEFDKDRRRNLVGSWAKAIGSGEKTLDQLTIANPEEYAIIAQDYYSLAALTNAQILRDKRQLHPAVSDQKTLDLFTNMEDHDLINTDLPSFRASLAAGDFNRIETRQRIALNKQKNREETSSHTNRFKVIMREYNKEEFNFFSSKQSDDQKKIQKQIIQEAELFIQGKIDQGKAPTDIELRQLMDRMMMPVSAGGFIETGITNFFSVSGTPSIFKTTLAEAKVKYSPNELENIRVDITDMPDRFKKDISERFIKAGINPTSDLIEQYAGAVITQNENRKSRLLKEPFRNEFAEFVDAERRQKITFGEILRQPKEKLGVEKEDETPFDEGTPIVEKLGTEEEKVPTPKEPFDEGVVIGETETPVEEEPSQQQFSISGLQNILSKEPRTSGLLNRLVKAKIIVESSGGLDKRDSRKGAIGPMQIMPETARNPGLGLAPIDPETLRDDKVNIEFGTRYIEALLKKYKGDMNKAVAAYNMGWNALDKLIAEHGNDYWAQMPKETREHVAKFRRAFTNIKEE